jgi:xylulokinase
MLGNRNIGSRIIGLNFNTHTNAHLFRAAQEGIVYSFRYGLDIMKETGIIPSVIKAGAANMFQSEIFREALSCLSGTEIHLYNTDGSVGAARGAGVGCGYFNTLKEAFAGLKEVGVTLPDKTKAVAYESSYFRWRDILESI